MLLKGAFFIVNFQIFLFPYFYIILLLLIIGIIQGFILLLIVLLSKGCNISLKSIGIKAEASIGIS